MIFNGALGEDPLLLQAQYSTNPLSKAAPPELKAYAQQIADNIVATVVGMPDLYRLDMLRDALEKVFPGMHQMALDEAKANPSLTRVQQQVVDAFGVKAFKDVVYENHYVSSRNAIATAIEHYIMRKLFERGMAARGQGPVNGLRLGDTISAGARAAMQQNVAPAATSAVAVFPEPEVGECTADGQFIWRGKTASMPGHWERLRAGEQCAVVGNYTGNENIGTSGGISSNDEGVKVSRDAPDLADSLFFGVGPFYLPRREIGAQYRLITWDRGVALPAEWSKKIAKLLATDQVTSSRTMYPRVKTTPGTELAGLREFIPDLPDEISLACIGTGDSLHDEHQPRPIMSFTHPFTKRDYALLLYFYPDKDAPRLVFQWTLIPEKSWLEKAIHAVVGAIFDFIEQVGSWIKDAVCAIFTSPLGPAIGAAAGAGTAAYFGKDPKTGAAIGGAGAQALAGACRTDPPPKPAPPPPPPPESSKFPLPLIIGGAALLGVLLLTPKKPKPE